MHRIPVSQIMQRSVITIRPEALVADAAQLMEDYGIRRLPVVDQENSVVGIVTDTDVLEAETAGSVLSTYDPDVEEEWLTVADIMTSPVITIQAGATVGQLAATLMEHKIGGMPVVEPEPEHPRRPQLVGIVTEMDIFAMIAAAWRAEVATQVAPT